MSHTRGTEMSVEATRGRHRGADLSRRAFVAATAALTVLVLAIQATWAVLTPGFRGPDEPHHVNSILRVASGHGWPDPGTAMVDPAVMDAAREAALITPVAPGFAFNPDRYVLRDPDSGMPSYYTAPIVPQPDRSAIGPVVAADPQATVRDQMTQHPPLYYVVGAGVARVLDLHTVSWDRALLTLRMLSILWTAPMVPSLVYIARRFGVRRSASLLAGLLPLALPQVTFIGAMVSNDAAAMGGGALAMAAMAAAATQRIRPATVVGAGAAVGWALWAKGQLLAMGLALVLVFLLHPGARWGKRIGSAIAAGVVSQIVCPWWIANIIRYGAVQPDGFQREPWAEWSRADADTAMFTEVVSRDFSTSFVAKFGWLEIPFPLPVVIVLLAALTVLVALGLVALARDVRASRGPVTDPEGVVPAGDEADGRAPGGNELSEDRLARGRLLAALSFLAVLGGILVVLLRASWGTYAETGQIGGVQGRYLFPFLGALVVGVVGLARVRRPAVLVGALVTIGVQVGGMLTLLHAFFPGSPVDLGRAAAVIGFDTPIIVGVVVAYAVLVAALIVGAFLLERHARRRGVTPAR